MKEMTEFGKAYNFKDKSPIENPALMDGNRRKSFPQLLQGERK